MDNSSYFQSQHPVVEELLTNKYFGDTLLVCANGHLTDNKLAVGLLFPCLLTSDIFALPIENVLLVPDYTMEEIGREFEKLIIGGSCKAPPPPSVQSLQADRLENDESPAELVIDDTIENGFDENCDNIEIGESNGDTIEIFVNNNEVVAGAGEEVAAAVVETDDIPPDIQVEVFTSQEQEQEQEEEEDGCTTDGAMFSIVRSEESSSPAPPQLTNQTAVTSNSDQSEASVAAAAPVLTNHSTAGEEARARREKTRWRQTKLRLQLEDDCVNVIENLPSLPDPQPEKRENSPKKSPKLSPKKESPVLEHRKPGRPRTKNCDVKINRNIEANGETRYKIKSALWVKSEKFKCAVCGKVLSCKGSYDRHIRMHEDNKPFKCSYCGKGFREACKRTVHERIHAGSKPFPCNLCSKSFRTSTQRMVHQRSHTKEKPYSCTVCGKVFSQPYSVKVHMEKFHKD